MSRPTIPGGAFLPGSVPGGNPLEDYLEEKVNEFGSSLFAPKEATDTALAGKAARYVISVKDAPYNAKGDGATDDTAAVVAAWSAAAASSTRALYFPAGTYKIASLASSLLLDDNMHVYGDGMELSTIWWVDGAFAGPLIASPGSSRPISNVRVSDLHIRGNHDSDYNQISRYPFLPSYINGLTLSRVKSSYSRVMGLAVRRGNGVNVDNCVVEYCGRDGINLADCFNVKVTNNRVQFCDDDSIAVHTQPYDVVDRGAVISGNTVRFAQGIKCLGAQSVTIVGNTLEFCMAQGILVASASSGLEGRNAGSGVVIVGNTIKNCIDRVSVDAANTNAPYIVINGQGGQTGGLSAIPGENVTASGTLISPYAYFGQSRGDETINEPIPGNYAILVANNVLQRDITDQAKISDLGFGSFYTRTGPIDPAITATSYLETGVSITHGLLRAALVANNVLMGLAAAFAVATNAATRDVVIAGNIVFDCTSGLSFVGTLPQGITFRDNVLDLDPFHVHSNRGANGTFLADGNPTAILMQSAAGVSAVRNTFRNCGRVTDTQSGTKIQFIDNILECDPASLPGFNAANKGIGNLPRPGRGFTYRIVDSDPASATFGNLLNACLLDSVGMPTTGKYPAGHFVNDQGTTVTTGKMLAGHKRLTTGSGHVAGTDWVPVYGTTS